MPLYQIEFRGREPYMVKIDKKNIEKIEKEKINKEIKKLENDIKKLQIKLDELKRSI